ELIGRYFTRAPRRALQGVGDDCARVAPAPGSELVLTADMLLEGRHFFPGADPRSLGHKALAVNLSDLAAGGATPRWFMLAIALREADEAWLAAFTEGLFALADRFDIELVGGDTTRGPLLTIAITAMGEAPSGRALGRAGARPGDGVWVSGAVGGAALALVHPELEGATRRLHRPEPRVALGEGLRGIASAAIDVSDGLAGDLCHLLERSAVGARIAYERIPKDEAFAGLNEPNTERRCVLSGGDDYELVFTAPDAHAGALGELGRALDLPLTRIGVIEAEPGLRIEDAGGRLIDFGGGYDHFAR